MRVSCLVYNNEWEIGVIVMDMAEIRHELDNTAKQLADFRGSL